MIKKLLAGTAILAALLATGDFAYSQLTTPVPSISLSQDGQPVITVPFNSMVGGPAASQMQDESQVATPVYASGGCTTTPAIVGNPYAFTFTNGAAGCSGSTLTLTLPAAAHKWVCHLHDVTNPTTTYDEQSAAASTTSIQFTNYTRTTGAVLTWVASDVLIGSCDAY